MLLIVGEARALVSSITARLPSDFCWIDGDERAFERAFALRAGSVLVVEDTATRSDARVRAGLSAMEAPVPGPRTFVLVTPRRPDDELVMEIKRRGVPFVIIHARRVIAVEASLPSRVLVARDEVKRTRDAVALDAVVDAVLRALTDDSWTGRTIELEAGGVVDALARRGAVPVVVPRWRARAASLLGTPCVWVDNDNAWVDQPAA